MSTLTAPRIPGSTTPLRCIDCDRPTYDNHLDQYCTDCLVEIIRDAVAQAEETLTAATKEATRILDNATAEAAESLAEAVELASLTDQVPTDLEERIAALRGVR